MGEIRVKSENLFDVTTVTNVYLDVRGVEHSSEVSRTSDYIPVTANTLYTLGMTGGSSSLNLTAYCFYDSNKEFLSSDTYQPSTIGNIVSITTPNNCAYFRFTYNQQRILVEFVSGVYNTFPPYFLTLPAHKKTSDGWKDIPTHTMTATGWQGELTSQSPLEFRATGQSLLDWRIDGASGGVGDWDETEQMYVIPVNVNGTTTNLYTDHQLMDGDSLDFTTDQTTIPITQGDNTLTVGTAVQPKSVFVKFEG